MAKEQKCSYGVWQTATWDEHTPCEFSWQEGSCLAHRGKVAQSGRGEIRLTANMLVLGAGKVQRCFQGERRPLWFHVLCTWSRARKTRNVEGSRLCVLLIVEGLGLGK